MTLPKTGTEVYVTTMTTFLYESYNYLENKMNHLKNIKLKSFPGDKVADLRAAILVDSEHLKSDGEFNTKHLGNINLYL